MPAGVGIWKVTNGRGEIFWKIRLGKRFTRGKVIVKQFKSAEMAEAWLFGPDVPKGDPQQRGILHLIKRAPAFVDQLTVAQITEAALAFLRLGDKSLTEVVDFYFEHARPAGGGKTFNQLLKFYLDLKQSKGVTKKHLRGLRTIGELFAEDFGTTPVNQINQQAVEAWLEELDLEPLTVGNYIRDLRSIFREAERREWCKSNPFANIKKPQVIGGEIACLTPTEVARLFVRCLADFAPLLGLKIFAGLRTSELLRLDWEQIHKAEIIIHAQQSKTRGRRVVTIQPNLARWLALAKPEEGLLWKKGQNAFHDAIARLAVAARVRLESNSFRKTFGSYHFAKFKNENLTASEMGNSPKVIFIHYRAVVSAEAATLFWSIDPVTAKKIAEGRNTPLED